jgi:hypothetical protein
MYLESQLVELGLLGRQFIAHSVGSDYVKLWANRIEEEKKGDVGTYLNTYLAICVVLSCWRVSKSCCKE